jgi:hypothetical protein
MNNSMSEEQERQREQERQEIQMLRTELQTLRAEVEAQRNNVGELISSRASGSSTMNVESTNENRMMAVMDNLQYARLDVAAPKFRGNGQTNPVEFLDEVDRFFRCKGIREEQKLVLVRIFLIRTRSIVVCGNSE